MKSIFALLPITLISLALAGCGGPELGAVEGVVTLNQKPVKGIEVTFEPVGTEGGTAMGYTNESGHYALQYPGRQAGAPPGDYVVKLSSAEGGPRIRIPARYNAQSKLKRTVEPGSNSFDFDLEIP